MNRLARVAKQIQGFLEGGSFPALAIAALVCWEALLIAILLIPPSPTPLGAFAEDFRVWCFGYDPSTGRMEWAYVMSMLTPQLMIRDTPGARLSASQHGQNSRTLSALVSLTIAVSR